MKAYLKTLILNSKAEIVAYLGKHKDTIQSIITTFFADFFVEIGTAVATYSTTGDITWSIIISIITAAARQAIKATYNKFKK